MQALPKVASGRGPIFLDLIMNRPDWIHRRVETITFLAEGGTKRRISYDFTTPQDLKPFVTGGRVGIPITQMKKVTLTNLDVTDAANASLSVWDTEDTGQMGVEVLQSAMSGFLDRSLSKSEIQRIKSIVFSKSVKGARIDSLELKRILREAKGKTPDDLTTICALVDEFASNFIFVVEVPSEFIGSRRLLKISFDQDIGGDGRFEDGFYLGVKFQISGQYFPNAGSYHLEINAPEGLQVVNLSHSIASHGNDRWQTAESSEVVGHLGHVHVHESMIVKSRFLLELKPTYSGLFFQAFVGLTLGWFYLLLLLIGLGKVSPLLMKASEAAPLATISLAIPAFLLTQLARSREHSHVQRILRKPRLIASISTIILFLSAFALVLDFSKRTFQDLLAILWLCQSILWLFMFIYRKDLRKHQ